MTGRYENLYIVPASSVNGATHDLVLTGADLNLPGTIEGTTLGDIFDSDLGRFNKSGDISKEKQELLCRFMK